MKYLFPLLALACQYSCGDLPPSEEEQLLDSLHVQMAILNSQMRHLNMQADYTLKMSDAFDTWNKTNDSSFYKLALRYKDTSAMHKEEVDSANDVIQRIGNFLINEK